MQRLFIMIKPISMKSLYRSNATIDTHQTSTHNCPSCRCSDLSMKLKHSVSQQFLTHRQQQPNLYLSNHLSEATSQHTSRPFLSGIFSKSTQKITFKYAAAVSPKHTNISFSYTSPPKNRKPHSLDSKFNTRKFKNQHFPLISQEDDTVSVKKIVKSGKESKEEKVASPYYQVYTGEKTPEKHRILKMKKEKSKQKLEITLSKKSSSVDKEDLPRSHDPLNEYQFDVPRNTPINALWVATSERSQKSFQHEDLHRYMNREAAPSSIEHISKTQTNSRTEIQVIKNTSPPVSTHRIPISVQHTISKEETSRRKYPTVESLDAYEGKIYIQKLEEQVRRLSQGETSLHVRQSEKGMSMEDIQLARSISEQLSLHYDYYYPQEQSDPSLSLHVAL